MKEEWRYIKEYEGLYQVSSLGRVKSLNYRNSNKEKILKLNLNKSGYLHICLSKNGKVKAFNVHRLVAQAFIPNPNNYPIINHKDEDKSNNCVNNLEWCTYGYNSNYGTCKHRISTTKKEKGMAKGKNNPFYGKHHTEYSKKKISENHKVRKVKCITTGKEFNTIKEAGEYYKIKYSTNISKCCRGVQKSAGKHPVTGEKLVWKYVE